MPLGCITQLGARRDWKEQFGLEEDSSPTYPPRTEKNVMNSDATVRFYTEPESAGEKCTLKYILKHNKPYFDVDLRNPPLSEKLWEWVEENKIGVLNVAGNSERTSPGIERLVYNYLTGTIDEFIGEYRFLSNFYPSRVELDRVYYPTVEHAFQAAKTLVVETRELIRNNINPAHAKKIGKSCVLRDGWDRMRLGVMENLLRQKFSQGPLRDKLLATTGDLVEGNWWGDVYWGVCRGIGENHLGKLLMKIRKEVA
jgi:ribA/ribD-fused uncharacterized protein